MEPTIHTITLDLQHPCKFGALTVKKGDTHRKLRLRLLSGGKPYPITQDCYGVFTAQKPDGTVLYNHCAKEENTLVYLLTPQTTAVAGTLECEIKLYGPADALLTTAAFPLTVEDTVYTQGDDAVFSAGEATALTQLVTQARDAVGRMEQVLEQVADYAVIEDTKVGEDAWSAKNIVDKLCPGLEETGPAVTCQPVEGYPLGILSTYSGEEEPGRLTLHHGGKNLLPKVLSTVTQTQDGTTFTLNDDGSVQVSGTPTAYSAAFYFTSELNAEHLRGKQITINHNVGENVYLAVNLSYNDGTLTTYNWLRGNRAESLTKVVPNNAKSLAFFVAALEDFDGRPMTFYPQLEFGTTPTDYESPKESKTYTVDLTTSMYDGGPSVYDWETGLLYNVIAGKWFQEDLETGEFIEIGFDDDLTEYPVKKIRRILAIPGTNCLSSHTDKPENACTTAVTGKADPASVIEKLTNAIIALGGNV